MTTAPQDEATTGPTRTCPYEGLLVVELADDPAGEMTGAQFAHLGARVAKVEPPEGAPSRHTGPFVGGVPHLERSLSHWYYNGSKASVVIDLATRAGHDDLRLLLRDADLVIMSMPPRRMRQLALDPMAMADRNPALVVVTITPFGLTGPWAEHLSSDLVAMAASGLLITSGYDDHSIPPIRPGGDQTFHTAASFAHMGALLALIQRQQTGRGDLVDVSIHDSSALSCELANPYWFYSRTLVKRQTGRHAQPEPTQPAMFQCSDGWIYFAFILADQKPWTALVGWMESQDLALDLADPAYLDLEHRQANFTHIQDAIEVFFLLQTAEAAYHEGQARGLPIGIVNAPEDVLHDEHLRARGFFHEVDHPGFGPVTHPGIPYTFSTYDSVPPEAAARLGQHTDAVLHPLRSRPEPPGSDGRKT